MRSKKIIMLLTNGFDPDVRVYKEAMYLVKKGHEVEILCWDRNPALNYVEKEGLDGIKIIRFRIPSVAGSGKKQLKAYLKYIICCKKYVDRKQYDFLHCHDIDGAIAGYLIKKKQKMIFDMHEYYEDVGVAHEFKRKLWRNITKYLIRNSVVALYENDLYLKDTYRAVHEKLMPLKNYPDSDLLVAREKSKSDTFRIGYHGAVRGQVPEFKVLFEAVVGMDDVRVDIHGGGPDYMKVKELSKQYKNVYVHGPFNGTNELTSLYEKTDIVYAGYRPWSDTRECAEVVKFFECIVTGTPIILTKAYTGMANRIENNQWGLTCDTLDVSDVKNAILKLKNDKEFWRTCSDNELLHAKDYDWKTAVRVLDKIYDM